MISRTFIIFILALALSAPLSVFAANDQGMERVDETGLSQANAAETNGTNNTAVAETNGSDASSTEGGFVSLTQLPAISDAADTNSLPQFLNTLYKICIGVGAVLAVLMIMFAGFLFMTSRGSVASNEKAKSYIQNAVLGLILLLSPTIVFSIINPDILKLDLNFDKLQPGKLLDIDFGTPGGFTGADAYLWEHSGDPDIDLKRCSTSGGSLVYECRKKDESGGKRVDKRDQCAADENKYNVCLPKGDVPMTQDQCTAQYPDSTIYTAPIDNGSSQGTSCVVGTTPVPHGCCVQSGAAGNICCARPNNLKYLLAYSFTRTPRSGTEGSCTYSIKPQYFSTINECRSVLDGLPGYVGTGNDTYTHSNLNIIKSCTPTTDTSYENPVGENMCKN